MEFRGDPEILAIFRDAGAGVDGERVRFEPGMCRRIIRASAPREFAQHARNPVNTVTIGGNHTVLCPSWGPPFVHDLDAGRRYATLDDFRKLVRIHHAIPHLHHSGGIVCEPVDVPAATRHLDMLYHHIRYSDAPSWARSSGRSARRTRWTWRRSCSARTSCAVTPASTR